MDVRTELYGTESYFTVIGTNKNVTNRGTNGLTIIIEKLLFHKNIIEELNIFISLESDQ